MSATLNNPDAPAEVRQPRLRVLLGQEEIPNAIRASVTSNNWYQSDTFDLQFSLYGDPKHGPAWWSAQDDMLLDVQVSLDAGQSWASLIVGVADHISQHPAQGVVQVQGRDMSARLIEAKTQETFANKTSSEIVGILATRHGMAADATPTKTQAGTYWKQDHAAITLNQFSRASTEWDMLTALAGYEGFDLYVTGKTLHFHPATPPDATPYAVQWTAPQQHDGASFGLRSNVQDIRMERALTLARDIEVVVKSWHSGQGRGFSKSARAIGAKSASAAKSANQKGFGGSTQRYVFVRPNLTEDQALKLAQSKLADLSKHERVITWQQPGDLVLTPRNIVSLRGTGTDFDQSYFVDSISRTIAFDQGFGQTVRAKNSDSRSQASVG